MEYRGLLSEEDERQELWTQEDLHNTNRKAKGLCYMLTSDNHSTSPYQLNSSSWLWGHWTSGLHQTSSNRLEKALTKSNSSWGSLLKKMRRSQSSRLMGKPISQWTPFNVELPSSCFVLYCYISTKRSPIIWKRSLILKTMTKTNRQKNGLRNIVDHRRKTVNSFLKNFQRRSCTWEAKRVKLFKKVKITFTKSEDAFRTC